MRDTESERSKEILIGFEKKVRTCTYRYACIQTRARARGSVWICISVDVCVVIIVENSQPMILYRMNRNILIKVKEIIQRRVRLRVLGERKISTKNDF